MADSDHLLRRIRQMFKAHRAQRDAQRPPRPPFPSRAWLLAQQRLLQMQSEVRPMSSVLYGMHDRQGAHIVPAGGFCVDTVALSESPAPADYTVLRPGINWLVRLNNAYGSGGTIPAPAHYGDFAKQCADYARRSRGAHAYIIGNEPNHAQERPNGDYIWPQMYADCFNQCYVAIKAAVPTARVIPAPVAPWDATTQYPGNPDGDWVTYFSDMLKAIPHCDGLALHTYTHGAGIHLLTSSARMQAPFSHRHFEFRAYRDFLGGVPKDKRTLPVYITETDQIDPWVNANTGWVTAAYQEIDGWNQIPGVQPIHCLCLYRWPNLDQWYIEGKDGVVADFKTASGRGYQSPPAMGQVAAANDTKTFIPVVSPGPTSAPALPPKVPAAGPIEWDERLTQRGVTVETPNLVPGQRYWRVKSVRWYDEQEADALGPDHHIMIDVLDVWGQRMTNHPVRITWPSDSAIVHIEQKSGEQYGQGYGMSPSRNDYSVQVVDDTPSEIVRGIGMGMDTPSGFNAGMHTSTGIVFERALAPQATQPTPPPVPQPPPDPAPIPVDDGDKWQRSRAFVARWEGGWADNPNDPGGATNKGITIGTFIRWRIERGLPTPTKDDLRNITDAEVEQIFFEWYWKASGSDKLAWPLCLANFDTAVNAGPGRAAEMMQLSGGDFLAYMGHLMSWYTRIQGFEHFGRAWIRRRAEILLEASK